MLRIKKTTIKVSLWIALFGASPLTRAAEKVYDLTLRQTTVNFTGREISHAISINNSIPGPTLRFRFGDTAVIKVTNESNEATNMHWHGLLVPFNMDGPIPNNKPIEPGKSFTFRFPIRQTGTYWYHAHSTLHEQLGLYGSIVIEDHHPRFNVKDDFVLVLSDWIDEHPDDVLNNLKKEGDWYAFKKGFLTSWLGAIRHGAVWDYIKSQWTRMGAMDLSDVAYDAFLINGQKTSQITKHYMPGDKVRLRIINAGASSYFYVNIGNLREFQVVTKDGIDVVPVPVTEILIGSGETYDLLFTVPEHAAFEVRATAQDITGHASFVFGMGGVEAVPNKIKPNPYKMDNHGDHGGTTPPDDGDDDHGGHDPTPPGNGGDHGDHDMPMPSMPAPDHGSHENGGAQRSSEETRFSQSKRLAYEDLKATAATNFDLSRYPIREIPLVLSGDMERFHWFINGKPFSEEQYIHIREGEVVRFKMTNATMMHHPMHLHGHFFRVLNGQGNFAPLFHTIDMAPGKAYTVEFLANEPGIWVFHCHNLYHMKMGMMRLVKYEGFEPPHDAEHSTTSKPHALKEHIKDDRRFYPRYNLDLFSNHGELEIGLNGGRYDVSLKLEVNEWEIEDLEAEAIFKRYLTNYFSIYTGAEFKDREFGAIVGLAYQLPMQIEVSGHTSIDGKVTVRLKKSIPIFSRLVLEPEVEYGTREQWTFESKLLYRVTNQIRAGAFYQFNTERKDHSIGVGMSFRF